MNHKSNDRFDDGFQNYLVEKASFIGEIKMPEIIDMGNIEIPKALIPFDKIKQVRNKRGYVHFYLHDKVFSSFFSDIPKLLRVLSQFDGVITPDCSMAIGQLDYLQMTNTYFNRASGVYLQQHGIPTIPTVRWSDEDSFRYCFNGLPKKSIIAISTHGCIKTNEQKKMFKKGLQETIERLQPKDVIVYGYMPSFIFDDFLDKTRFHRYPNAFEQFCKKEV